MRSYITQIVAVIVIIGSIYGARQLMAGKKKPPVVTKESRPTAWVVPAKNEFVPITINEMGRLVAKTKIDIYSEVQGVMLNSPKEFKTGVFFKKGETMLRIKSEDFYANLLAQKSVFQNLLTSILPDLKLDYPQAFVKWDTYVRNFDVHQPIADLPEPESDKEKYFLTGKNVYTTYYSTKNLEIILEKYTLKAPFDGILTESLVNSGALIRNGQKLGEFIQSGEFELELAISAKFLSALELGMDVEVLNPENESQKWTGKISRINGKINPTMQTVEVFVAVSGADLQEGMYLEAQIRGKGHTDALKVSRNSLVDDRFIYLVAPDSTLELGEVDILHKSRTSVVLGGIKDGQWVVTQPIPGAYSGMKVTLKIQE
jgi:multidrug efflux pump subunit AcrA (membrane-fusion protein)